MNALRQILIAAIGLAIAASAPAQDQTIRILVGSPAGSSTDVIARLAADKMRAALGVPVIVDNKPGASGMLAAELLKNAAPDGRTLMASPIAVTVLAPLTQSGLRYDPVKDFAPVSLAANFQFALAVGAASPARSVREYIAWARDDPARLAYGIPLAGGPGHFLGVMLAKASGLDLAPVPYKGSPPLVTDLIGGQVPAGIALVSDFVAQHRAGKLRMIACFGPQRSPAAPNVPTIREEGFTDAEGLGWIAFHTVAGTPRETIDRQSRAIASAIRSPEVSEKLLSLGLEPVGSTPDEFASRAAEDTVRWSRLVKVSGFSAGQ